MLSEIVLVEMAVKQCKGTCLRSSMNEDTAWACLEYFKCIIISPKAMLLNCREGKFGEDITLEWQVYCFLNGQIPRLLLPIFTVILCNVFGGMQRLKVQRLRG